MPKHLARRVRDLYFNPQHGEFAARTMWSFSNAFTSAFKELDPIPQFKATAKLGQFPKATSHSRFNLRAERPTAHFSMLVGRKGCGVFGNPRGT